MLSTRSSWRRLKISIRSRHSRRALPTHRSMCAFAFGAWTGVRITLIPSPWKTASKAQLNFESRSWINNRGRWPRSSRSINRLRACCSIQAPSGLLAHATYSIRRLPMQMNTSTSTRRSRTVSTVRKSQANVVAACARRNERQSSWPRWGAGGTPAALSKLRTKEAETSIPSLRSSPTYPDVAPAAVLARQPQDQLAHLAVDRRSTGATARVRPVSSDQLPVPAQQRLGPHHERLPRATRQHAAQRREQQPVTRRVQRPSNLPPQDRQLVTQHQDL